MKTQFSTGCSHETLAQIKSLVEEFGYSQREIFTLAIGEFYSSRIKPHNWKNTATWLYGSQAVVCKTREEAESFQWVISPSVAIKPSKIEIAETDEPIGLKPYKFSGGSMGWTPELAQYYADKK